MKEKNSLCADLYKTCHIERSEISHVNRMKVHHDEVVIKILDISPASKRQVLIYPTSTWGVSLFIFAHA